MTNTIFCAPRRLLQLQFFYSRSAFCVVFLCLSFFNFAEAEDAQEVDELTRRFNVEAPQKWAEYAVLATHLSGKVHFKRVDLKSKKIVTDETSDLTCEGQYFKSTNVHSSGLSLLVGNPDYTFILKKQGTDLEQQASGAWMLDNVTTIKEKNLTPVQDGPLGGTDDRLQFLKATCKGLVIMSTWVPNMVKDTSFFVKSISYVSDDKSLVEVKYSYEQPSVIDNNFPRSGTMQFDPNNYWLVHSISADLVSVRKKATFELTNYYTTSPSGLPIVTKQIMHVRQLPLSKDSVEYESTSECNFEESKKDADPAEFTLTAYGFPEPGIITSERSRMLFLWISTIVTACLLVAVIRKWATAQRA